ncbi:MAG: hypothetical protein E2O39_01300, partial [Planctomycetota bacterium]
MHAAHPIVQARSSAAIVVVAAVLCYASCGGGESRSSLVAGCNGAIGDFVWLDSNCDGIQDEDEPGIANVMVFLELVDRSGGIREEFTDSDGHYEFNGLCAGTYVVSLDAGSPLDGLAPSPCEVGDDPEVDSNCSPSTVVLVEDGTVDRSVDFGFGFCGSIGDFVWLDSNCNGIQDEDELGIAGVRVR